MQPNYRNILITVAMLIVIALSAYFLMTNMNSTPPPQQGEWCNVLDPTVGTDNDMLDKRACAESTDVALRDCCIGKYEVWGGE